MAPFDQVISPYEDELARLQAELEMSRTKSQGLDKKIYEKPESDWRNVLAQAVLTLAPAALGAAIGGKEGGALGFQAGGAGADRFLQSVAEEQKRRQALAFSEKQDLASQIKGLEQESRGIQSKLTDTKSKVALKALENKEPSTESKRILQSLLDDPARKFTAQELDTLAKDGIKDTVIDRYRQTALQAKKFSDGGKESLFEEDEYAAFERLSDDIKGNELPGDARTVASNKYLQNLLESARNRREYGARDLREAKLDIDEEKAQTAKDSRTVPGYTGRTRTPKQAVDFADTNFDYDRVEYTLNQLKQSLIRGGDTIAGEEAVIQGQLLANAMNAIKKKENFGAAFTELEAQLTAGLLPALKRNPVTGSLTKAQLEGALGRDPFVAIDNYLNLLEAERVMQAANLGLKPKKLSAFGKQLVADYEERGMYNQSVEEGGASPEPSSARLSLIEKLQGKVGGNNGR